MIRSYLSVTLYRHCAACNPTAIAPLEATSFMTIIRQSYSSSLEKSSSSSSSLIHNAKCSTKITKQEENPAKIDSCRRYNCPSMQTAAEYDSARSLINFFEARGVCDRCNHESWLLRASQTVFRLVAHTACDIGGLFRGKPFFRSQAVGNASP